MLGLLDALAPAMRAAGRLIEAIRLGGATTLEKADKSPVTEADTQAEALLEAAILAIEPHALIIGEEGCAMRGSVPLAANRFWLLDPLDGTRSFVEGSDDYSVNVGLVVGGEAVAGLLLAPRSGVLWAGVAGEGAWREDADGRRRAIRTRALAQPPVAVTSRSHLDRRTRDYCDRAAAATEPSGSSLKFCLLAEGLADVYPRFSPTSEWDTAAGHAILSAAGGEVVDENGAPFRYGKPGAKNPGFLAVGDPAAFALLPPLSA